MNARIHQLPTRPVPTDVPEQVAAGLDRCMAEFPEISTRPCSTHVQHAERAEEMAAVYEREAELWQRLSDWTYTPDQGVPLVFGHAAIQAGVSASERAQMYAGVAADYRRLAAGLPVCGVIGCGCGGDCGVQT